MAAPSAGLIAHWKLSDGSGADMSSAGHSATFYGGVTPIVDGPMSNAVSFDGGSFTVIASDDVINIPYVSISAWVKTTLAGAQIIGFSEGYASTGASDKDLFITSDGKLSWYVYVGGTAIATAAVPITDGNWHHVAGTYEEHSQCIYFDGALVAGIDTTGQSYTGYTQINIMMGGRGGTYGTTSFLGSQSDFLLYNRALTAAEIAAIYAEGAAVAPSGIPLKVWTGTAWVTKPVKVWFGGAWQTKPVKVWSGSAWR